MRNLKDAIDIFGQWAEQGKDVGMEKGHTPSVNEMLSFAPFLLFSAVFDPY